MKRLVGPALILACTLIWGSAFVAQKTGAPHYGPFALTCYRNILAGLFLALCILVRNRVRGVAAWTGIERSAIRGGCLSGLVLFAAMATQQLGIEHTSPGISAFLTANYILLVPFLAWAIGRGRPGAGVWSGVLLAVGGTYFICQPTMVGFSLGLGEAWTLLCAFLFAIQIMIVDRFAPRCDVLVFSMIQLFAAALFAAPFLLLPSEAARLTRTHFLAGWFSLFYVGILSSGVAYTLQNLGQARTPPALAAIVMSFESVVGALSGYLFLGDRLTAGQCVGCVLVFLAIGVSQFVSVCGSKQSAARANEYGKICVCKERRNRNNENRSYR